MKRLILLAIAALAVGITFAAPLPPRHGPRPAPRPHVTHVHHHSYHYHHHGAHPGAFWGGFAGALLGTTIYEVTRPELVIVAAPAPQPTVIIQNPAISRQVQVEGHYENQVLANGSIVKIWVPGRWVEVR